MRVVGIAAALACGLLALAGCGSLGLAGQPGGALVLELGPEQRRASDAVLYLERVADPQPRAPGPRVFEVSSEGPGFAPPLQVVRPGSDVVFVNRGELAHRLFSADDRGRRERHLDPGGRSEPLPIARAGGQRFYCSLHPEESFSLFASPSDHFLVPDGRPVHRIEALPAGAYRLSWWSDAGVRTAGHVEIRPGATARRALRDGPAAP
jgi:plastocyanin